MGKLPISMAIFNSYVKLPKGNHCVYFLWLSFFSLLCVCVYIVINQPETNGDFWGACRCHSLPTSMMMASWGYTVTPALGTAPGSKIWMLETELIGAIPTSFISIHTVIYWCHKIALLNYAYNFIILQRHEIRIHYGWQVDSARQKIAFAIPKAKIFLPSCSSGRQQGRQCQRHNVLRPKHTGSWPAKRSTPW